MRKFLLLFIISFFFLNCQTEIKREVNFIGYYDTIIMAASSPGRLISLEIQENGKAYFSTDYLNSTPEFVDTCEWKAIGKHKMELKVQNDMMIFKKENSLLTYLGGDYGDNGLVLNQKKKPIPTTKKLYTFLKKENDTTYISFGGKTISWDIFHEPIKNLTLKDGDFNTAWILRIPEKNGKFTYEFIEFIQEEE